MCNEHVKQWWNDGDDTLEKVALHYGAEEPDVARFILAESIEVGERAIGYFQYYVVSKEIIGIDQFIGEPDRINQGVGTAAIKLFLEMLITSHKPQQIIIDPNPENKRAIRCYENVGFVYYAMQPTGNGGSSYMMKFDCERGASQQSACTPTAESLFSDQWFSNTLHYTVKPNNFTKNHKKCGCNLEITGHSKPLLGNRITGIQQPIQFHRNFPRITPFERGSHDGFIRISASLLNGCDRRLG